MLKALTIKSRVWPAACLFCVIVALRGAAQTDQSIYTDSLQNQWLDWGWASLNYTNTTPVHSGTASIAVTINTNTYQAIYIAHNAFNSSPYASLVFWLNGGASGGQQLQVRGHAGGQPQSTTNLPPLAANTWRQYVIPLSTLGVANRTDMDGFWIQDRIGAAQPTFYLDDITLAANSSPPPSISLTSPANNARYGAPASIPLTASITTNGHSITKVQLYNGATLLNEDSAPPYSFNWTNVDVGIYSLMGRLIYDGGASLDSAAVSVTVTGIVAAAIHVDAQASRHPISPLIYGVAFASLAELAELNFTLNRSGGNAETRYNWQLNAHNRAADWYFESLADGSSTPGASADSFVATSKSGGAEPLLTVSMIGWAPKLGPNRGGLSSFSIAKYGAQTGNDGQWFADAGNGISSATGAFISNDMNDANFQTNSAFQQGWVQYLTNHWGASTNGGVRYYLMDNEHSIWHGTHRDIHPVGATMQEIRDKFFDYAGMVKAIDPNALVLAPEEWGWSGYIYSGYDQWYGSVYGWGSTPDRAANGNQDYLPWLLDQLYQRSTNTNQRLLDYFTVHIYPQNGETDNGGNDVSTYMQSVRNASTRSLWDPNYLEPNWIQNYIMLIPRIKSWVAGHYPGTRTGITEYNWGAEGHINGATAQADILGILGREGLDLATRWTTPASASPTFKAMKLYRNYDENKSCFGDTSVSATGPNPDQVSTFASVRSADGALTIMVINKQLVAGAALTLSVTNFPMGGLAQGWQLTSANSISRLNDVVFSGNTFTSTVPEQSITLFVLPPGPPRLRLGAANGDGTLDFWLDGQAGLRYFILSSTNFANWLPVQTNTLTSNSWHITLSATSQPQQFYRGQLAP